MLEAAACGLPVICTQGGPTDDFAHPRYFLGIKSRRSTKRISATETNIFLVPDFEHLMVRLRQVIEQDELRDDARRQLPEWIHDRFSWQTIARKLRDVLFSSD